MNKGRPLRYSFVNEFTSTVSCHSQAFVVVVSIHMYIYTKRSTLCASRNHFTNIAWLVTSKGRFLIKKKRIAQREIFIVYKVEQRKYLFLYECVDNLLQLRNCFAIESDFQLFLFPDPLVKCQRKSVICCNRTFSLWYIF